MKPHNPTEEQVAQRRYLQWRYGEDKIQELKDAGKDVDLQDLRQALIASIDATGLTQMQHDDAAALLGIDGSSDMERHILEASGTALCAVLWATSKEHLLPE